MGEPVVLTSENSAEFYAKVLNLSEPAKAVESAEEVIVADAEKAAQQQTSISDKPDVPKKEDVRVRFSELTEQRKTAEAKAEKAEAEVKVEREARALAEKRAQEAEAKLAPPEKVVEELGPEPQREQFATDKDYAQSWADWTGEKQEREAAEKRTIAEREKTQRLFVERQALFKAATPDYEQVINASTVEVSNDVRDAIIESEVGPQLLHHFAQHPEDAEKLKKLSRVNALKEVGKLEDKIIGAAPVKASGEEKAVVAAQEISRAPAPITPLKGANAPAGSPVNSKGEYFGTHADYKAARKAGLIK